MTGSYERAHSAIVKLLVGSLAAGLSLWLSLAAVTYTGQQDAFEQAQARNAFWTTLADPAAAEPGVSQTLARELGTLNAETPITAADDYAGRPNAFSGIDEELGFQPFDESVFGACDCGPLSADLVADIQTFNTEGLPAMLADLTPPGVALTDAPLWAEALVVWQLIAAAAMTAGLRMHGQPGMTWRRDDGHADRQEIACMAMAPVFMLIYLTAFNRRRLARQEANRHDQLEAKGLLDIYVRLGAQIDRLQGQTDTAARSELAKLIEVRTAIVDAADAETARDEARQIDAHVPRSYNDELLTQAQDILDARRLALSELDGRSQPATG